ncbi:MAG: PAS domain S-box protein, partial [Acidobacteriota bacterium]
MKELYSAGSRAHNRGTVGAQIFEIRSGQDLSSSLETGEVSRYLLDHSRDLILALDKRGKVLFANRHALNVVGYSPEEFIGKPILRFLPSGSARKVLLMLALEFLGRPQAESEFQVKTKSGETRYIRLAEGSAFIRDGGRVAGILVTGTDITGQRKAEIDAQASEARFRDLWENAPVAYQIADLKGTITDANQTEARLLGYRRGELVGKSMFDLIAPKQRAIVEENFRLKIAGKPAPKSRQRTFIRKDGSSISLMVDDTLERDAKGKL